jgi:hypothetical protein
VEEFNQRFTDRAVRRRKDVRAVRSSCFRPWHPSRHRVIGSIASVGDYFTPDRYFIEKRTRNHNAASIDVAQRVDSLCCA